MVQIHSPRPLNPGCGTWCGNGRDCLCERCFDLDLDDRRASLRARRDPIEGRRRSQIVETERYRNIFEEKPQNRQADRLGTRV